MEYQALLGQNYLFSLETFSPIPWPCTNWNAFNFSSPRNMKEWRNIHESVINFLFQYIQEFYIWSLPTSDYLLYEIILPLTVIVAYQILILQKHMLAWHNRFGIVLLISQSKCCIRLVSYLLILHLLNDYIKLHTSYKHFWSTLCFCWNSQSLHNTEFLFSLCQL